MKIKVTNKQDRNCQVELEWFEIKQIRDSISLEGLLNSLATMRGTNLTIKEIGNWEKFQFIFRTSTFHGNDIIHVKTIECFVYNERGTLVAWPRETNLLNLLEQIWKE